jgi:hypothetical protein
MPIVVASAQRAVQQATSYFESHRSNPARVFNPRLHHNLKHHVGHLQPAADLLFVHRMGPVRRLLCANVLCVLPVAKRAVHAHHY